MSPDERVTFIWTPTVGYGGGLLLNGNNHKIFTTASSTEIAHTTGSLSTAAGSVVPVAGDVVILPNGRAREVGGYSEPTFTLVGADSAKDESGANFSDAELYHIPAANVAAATSFVFSQGSNTVTVSGSPSITLAAGDLIQPLLPSGAGNHATDLPVVKIQSISGNITLESAYTGDNITTTKVVKRTISGMAADLGSYFNLTADDFHNVEVPAAGQKITHTIPENTFL